MYEDIVSHYTENRFVCIYYCECLYLPIFVYIHWNNIISYVHFNVLYLYLVYLLLSPLFCVSVTLVLAPYCAIYIISFTLIFTVIVSMCSWSMYIFICDTKICLVCLYYTFLLLQILLFINNRIFYIFVFNSSAYVARISMLAMGFNICRFHLCTSYFI